MADVHGAFPFRREILRAAEAQGISLSDDQVRSMEIHRDLLMAWGRRMNLTAIRDPGEMIRRHFLEGLLAGEFLGRNRASGTVLDLGSGNGFPAVPIRVARPEAAPLILVESSRKRAAFLRALLRELGWGDSRVEVRRVEGSVDLQDLSCDIFTTRGVTPFDLLKEGLPFLKRGGFALLFMRHGALDREIPRLPPELRVEAESPLEGREAGMILLSKQ
jgi:16S rRNA (guanine527-N7)-methyltransferase